MQAFGVGALEDDDEDVYHRDSMSRYDTVLGEEEPGDGLYGWTAPQQYTKKRGNAAWKLLETPLSVYKGGKKKSSLNHIFIFGKTNRHIQNLDSESFKKPD